MRVNIDEIKESGTERTWDVTREALDEAVAGDPAGYRAAEAAHVEAHLERLGRRVRLVARTGAELTALCGRCLAPVRVAVPVAFELTMVPAEEADEERAARHEKGDAHRDGSFAPYDVDEETYRGKVIDLDPLVREQLLLALPRYPVCQENCKGLCPVCGQNLNEKDCGCERHVPDPRWAGLEKLKRS
ncbi:MAG TPA: DUF177 domain-containing protein [Anaeromyxobacteraceae bacterium]|nr:DUF177 domain-containing protein [Anaeromyxobacteraceae bacterium]